MPPNMWTKQFSNWGQLFSDSVLPRWDFAKDQPKGITQLNYKIWFNIFFIFIFSIHKTTKKPYFPSIAHLLPYHALPYSWHRKQRQNWNFNCSHFFQKHDQCPTLSLQQLLFEPPFRIRGVPVASTQWSRPLWMSSTTFQLHCSNSNPTLHPTFTFRRIVFVPGNRSSTK